MNQKINIIIPLYNEANRIGDTLQRLLKFLKTNKNLDITVYLVDDGSEDNSAEIIKTYTKDYNNFILLSYKENRGKGYAFRFGVKNSEKADYYYLADADGSANWDVLNDFLNLIQQNDLDCIIGSRSLDESDVSRNFLSRSVSKFSNFLIRLTLNIPYHDTQCGYKLFNSKCYKHIVNLQTDRFGFDFELVSNLHHSNIKIKEVGIKWIDKKGSSVKPTDYLKTFIELIKILNFKRGKSIYIFITFLLICTYLFLRIPSLFEPYWYGDEGIYAAVASQLMKGDQLYIDAWDHKPPGIFILYTVIGYISQITIFDYQFLLRFFNLLFGGIVITNGMLLAKLMYNKKLSLLVGIILTILIGSPYLEGNILNAENVFIVLTSLGYLIFYRYTYKNKQLTNKIAFVIGTLFGIAIFIKIQPLFEMLGLMLLVLMIGLRHKIALRRIFTYLITLLIFSIIPIFSSVIYFKLQGKLDEFVYANLTYNFSYATGSSSQLLSPTLIMATLFFLFIVLSTGLFLSRKINNKYYFILIWLICSAWGASLSDRPYAHYLLQLVVPLSVFIGLIFHYSQKIVNRLKLRKNFLHLVLSAGIIVFLLNVFPINKYEFGYILNKREYYSAAYKYIVKGDEDKFMPFFWYSEKELHSLAELVKIHGNDIWIWESNSWFIWLNNLEWPTRYVANFHIDEENSLDVINDLDTNEVEIVVIKKEKQLPKPIDNYLILNYKLIQKYENYYVYKRTELY